MLPVWLTDHVTPDLDRAVHYTLLWGLEGVVLRTVGGEDDRVPFVNEEKLRRRLAEHDLPCVAVDPGVFEGEVADRLVWMNERIELAETFAFCRRLSCSIVLTGALSQSAFDAEAAGAALRQAGAAAQKAGVTLAVRNDLDTACASGEHLASILEAADHPYVRAAWNPADALQAGHDPTSGLAALGDRVALLFVRDGAVRDEAGRGDKHPVDAWEKALPGEGEVGWAQQLEHLARQGFGGPACLLVSERPRAQAGGREAYAMIRAVRQANRAVGAG